ncbi:TfoX/Sxy family protein [Oricola cellulosilytica]|uniref:TfoX family protein n=1 Tax=Oricola cellulosilytica TaxID=1429082 RepID=A0A4R0PED7_9HYPH|nr:TfoX/Sxy family protein [Oricola cellulosilytica]TCD13733.1 TfoX family protein [Oricola cellulosilytica]
MAYDEKLAERMRDMLAGLQGLSEKRMMGGVCFLLDGNMVGGAHREKKSGEGRLMLRVGKEQQEEALKRPGVTPMIHGGRAMGGFVHAGEDTDLAVLRDLVSMAVAFTGSLPPK